MAYIIIIVLIILSLGIGVGCKITSDKKQTKFENMAQPKDSIPEIFTKQEIEKKLKRLAKSNPKNLEYVSAMCYEMAMPPERAEYVCPICGEKTLYSNFEYSKLLSWDLQSMRNQVEELHELNAKLDESQFCKSCNPDIEKPELCLIIKLQDQEEHKTCKIEPEDLVVLKEFIDGEIVHIGGFDDQYPLNHYILRITELLGFDAENYIK